MSGYKELPSNRKDYLSKKFLALSQDEVLELAVKAVVNPTYGWLTAVLIIYGCRPIEAFSLIASSNGHASVINFDENPASNIRRDVLASPIDFVEKLNICDQVSQPVFCKNFDDYNFDELNSLILNWNSWFKGIKGNLKLDDLRIYWVKRILTDGLPIKSVAKYMGLTTDQFCKEYL